MLSFLLLSAFLQADNSGAKSFEFLTNNNCEKFELPQAAPTIAGFTLADVAVCAKFADIAYKINKKQDYELPQNGKLHQFATENEASGFIFEAEDGKIYVSYKGTSSVRNTLTDLWCNWAFADEERQVRYHNGIMKGYQRTADQVVSKLLEIAGTRGVALQDLADNLIFTGHSLGGGLAQIAANEMRRQFGVCAKLATFAAPRVMDYETAQQFDEAMGNRTITVSQMTDPVCSAMFGTVFGAKHVGKKLLLPYHRQTLQHKMGGYLKALEALHDGDITASQMSFFNFRAAEKEFTFAESENQDGFGSIAGSCFIGDSNIPNPLGVAKEGRFLFSTLVERPVHRVLASMKDAAFASIPTAKKVGIWAFERLSECTVGALKQTANSAEWLLNTYKDLKKEESKSTAKSKLSEAAGLSYGVFGKAVSWGWSCVKDIAPKVLPTIKAVADFSAKETVKNVKSTWHDYRNLASRKLKNWGYFKKD